MNTNFPLFEEPIGAPPPRKTPKKLEYSENMRTESPAKEQSKRSRARPKHRQDSPAQQENQYGRDDGGHYSHRALSSAQQYAQPFVPRSPGNNPSHWTSQSQQAYQQYGISSPSRVDGDGDGRVSTTEGFTIEVTAPRHLTNKLITKLKDKYQGSSQQPQGEPSDQNFEKSKQRQGPSGPDGGTPGFQRPRRILQAQDASTTPSQKNATPGSESTEKKNVVRRKAHFAEHLSRNVWEKLVESKEAFVGRFHAPSNSMEGYVTIEGWQNDVFIPSKDLRNRAFDGDEVVIRLLPPSKWRIRKGKAVEVVDDANAEPRDEPRQMDAVLEMIASLSPSPSLSPMASDLSNLPTPVDLAEQFDITVDSPSALPATPTTSKSTNWTSSTTPPNNNNNDDVDNNIGPIDAEQSQQAVPAETTKLAQPKTAIEVTTTITITNADETTAVVGVGSEVAMDSVGSSGFATPTKTTGSSRTQTPVPTHDQVPTAEDIQLLTHHQSLQALGQIVAIAKCPANKTIIGMIRDAVDREANELKQGAKVVNVIPLQNTMPFVIVNMKDAPQSIVPRIGFKDLLFEIRITSWSAHCPYPMGKVVSCIGTAGSLDTASLAIKKEFHIRDFEFPAPCLGCLPAVPFSISKQELDSRTDFTNERVFSIDPATARDLDDALHIRRIDNNHFEVGVHIADVSHFLREGTPLDLEAQQRTCSHYLVKEVVPMLPRTLCDDLCSLLPNVPRLTFSAVLTLNSDAQVVDRKFTKSVILSKARMNYEQAQDILDGKETSFSPEICQDVHTFYDLSKKLRDQRFENGAVQIDSSKLRFQLDEKGSPISFSTDSSAGGSHSLIEEFMLLANIEVAQFIARAFPSHAVLRRHPPPSGDNSKPIERLFREFDISINLLESSSVAHAIGALRSRLPSNDLQAITELLIRQMTSAEYFCAGSKEERTWMHYALAVRAYTHFTSPIRRYPDVLVHRLLTAALEVQKPTRPLALTDPELVDLLHRCNETKRAARKASDELSNIYLGEYLRLHGPLELEAIVFDIWEAGFAGHVPLIGFTARVFIDRTFRCSSATFNPDEYILEMKNVSVKIAGKREAKKSRASGGGKKELNKPHQQAAVAVTTTDNDVIAVPVEANNGSGAVDDVAEVATSDENGALSSSPPNSSVPQSENSCSDTNSAANTPTPKTPQQDKSHDKGEAVEQVRVLRKFVVSVFFSDEKGPIGIDTKFVRFL